MGSEDLYFWKRFRRFVSSAGGIVTCQGILITCRLISYF